MRIARPESRRTVGSELRIAGAAAAILVIGFGCASPTAEESFERGPLPYHVAVYVDRATSEFAPPPVDPSKPGSAPAAPGTKPGAAPKSAPDGSSDVAPNAASARSRGTGGGLAGGGGGGGPGNPAPASAEGEAAADPSAEKEPEPEPAARYLLDADTLAQSIARSLAEGSGTVAKAVPLSASSRDEAVNAARAGSADLLLVVSFKTRSQYDERQWIPGWCVLEVGFWLFGGIPSWFIPSVKYLTRAELDVETVDLSHARAQGKATASAISRASSPPQPAGGGGKASPDARDPNAPWEAKFESPGHNVSLWNRSHPFHRPGDYLLTILVPPLVLYNGEAARLSDELTADVTSDLESQLADSLRARLLEGEKSTPLSVCFMAPDPTDAIEEPSVSLKIAVASRGAGRIVALDVHRFATSTEKYRWVMPAPQITELANELSAMDRSPAGVGASDPATQGGGYVYVALPDPIPLAPGENTVKVRLLRDDGEQITRTMVYVRGE